MKAFFSIPEQFPRKTLNQYLWQVSLWPAQPDIHTAVEINQDQSDEKSQVCLFTTCVLADSKAKMKKERLLVCPDWRLLAGESCRQAKQKWDILGDWWGCVFGFLCLVLSLKLSVINQGMIIWGWLLQSYCSASWIVTTRSNLSPRTFDLE